MGAIYLAAPIFNRPQPLMRAGGTRSHCEETDVLLIKIDSFLPLPSWHVISNVNLQMILNHLVIINQNLQ